MPGPEGTLATALRDNGLTQALFNLPAGDWDKGERGMAALPGREAAFRASVVRAAEYAEALGCKTVNCLAGIPDPTEEPKRIRATFVENVRFAADALKKSGVRLAIEPINNFDIPGFWLNRVALAATSSPSPDRTTPTSNTTSITSSERAANWSPPSNSIRSASPTSSSPTIPAAMNPAPARSTIHSFSANSTSPAMPAGLAVNTGRWGKRRRD